MTNKTTVFITFFEAYKTIQVNSTTWVYNLNDIKKLMNFLNLDYTVHTKRQKEKQSRAYGFKTFVRVITFRKNL